MYEYKARVTAVYDGDTITADIDLGFGVWLKGQKVRLYGIDAPELRRPTLQAGRESRDELRAWVLNCNVYLQTRKDKKGKYGRWLAHVISANRMHKINMEMVKSGHAVNRKY